MTPPSFAIRTRDPRSRARTGTLRLAHGEVRTPAFVPLATKAVVRDARGLRGRRSWATRWCSATRSTSSSRPATSLIAAPGRPARLHALGPARSSPTPAASRSSRWGTAPSPTRSRVARRGRPRRARSSRIEEEGVRFRSYVDGSAPLHGARDLDGGPGRARLGHRARLRRVHAVPRHARVHGALDGAHPPLAGPLPGLARRARPAVAGGLRDRPGRGGRGPAACVGGRGGAPRPTSGWPSAARSGRTRRRCTRSSTGPRRSCRRSARATCSGSATSTTCCAGVELGMDTFDCAMPTRIGRHGMALVPDPEAAGASTWRRAATARPTSRSAPAAPARRARRATRAPTCTTCSRIARDGLRLLTLHNLAFLRMLMAALRDAVAAGRLAEATAAVRAGAAPWRPSGCCPRSAAWSSLRPPARRRPAPAP